VTSSRRLRWRDMNVGGRPKRIRPGRQLIVAMLPCDQGLYARWRFRLRSLRNLLAVRVPLFGRAPANFLCVLAQDDTVAR
jgi:hypothetical protein